MVLDLYPRIYVPYQVCHIPLEDFDSPIESDEADFVVGTEPITGGTITGQQRVQNVVVPTLSGCEEGTGAITLSRFRRRGSAPTEMRYRTTAA